jgi:hypothetical protein
MMKIRIDKFQDEKKRAAEKPFEYDDGKARVKTRSINLD